MSNRIIEYLSDQEIYEFLKYYGQDVSGGRLLAESVLTYLINNSVPVTEVIADAYIADQLNLSLNKYNISDIENLSADQLLQFGQVFGLDASTERMLERVLRILRYKGMLNIPDPILYQNVVSQNTIESNDPPKVSWKLPVPDSKNRAKAEKYVKNMVIEVTGARPGEELVGRTNVTKNAIIIIEGAIIPPNKSRLAELWIYPDLFRSFMNKLSMFDYFAPLSIKERAEWLINNTHDSNTDLSEVDGLKIKIVQLGESNLGTKLEQSQINELSENPSRLWVPMDVRNMFPRKPGSRAKRQTLFFLKEYWQINATSTREMTHSGITVDIKSGNIMKNGRAGQGQNIIVVKNVDGQDIGFIVESNSSPIDENSVYKLILSKYPDKTLDDIKYIDNTTSKFTPGAYRSLMQKINRYRPKKVEMGGRKIEAGFVQLVILGLLLLHPGSFIPDIQSYVTGIESFCKRLAVTILEDSYVEPKRYGQLVSMMASSLVIKRVKGWRPTIEMIDIWFDIALESLASDMRFKYDITEGLQIPEYHINSGSTPLEAVSVFLNDIRSFSGDLAMVRYIAKYGGISLFPTNNVQPESMPLEHAIDQHWTTEIGYFYEPVLVEIMQVGGSAVGCGATSSLCAKQTAPFHNLFKNLFQRVTGVNSRKEQLVEDNFLAHTRLAQQRVLLAKQSVPVELNKLEYPAIEYPVVIDSAWFSGLVGALDIPGRPEALVTLRPEDLDQLIAIQKPSRSMKDANLTDKRHEKAIETAEAMMAKGVPLNKAKPPVSILEGSHLIRKDDTYFVDINGTTYNIDQMKNFNINIIYEESKELTVENALSVYGNGITFDAAKQLQSLVENTSIPVIRRALTYLTGFKSVFNMNKISRDGRGSELTVTKEDPGAFQFLLKLSLIYPLAIRRVMYHSLRFEVPMGPLLWSIRDYLRSVVTGGVIYDGSMWNNRGEIKDKSGRNAWDHQLESLEDMKRRNMLGKKGHFIWIPVGLGKTWIVLSYLKYLKDNNKLPNHIIYTLPDSAIKSIIREIQHFGFNVELLYPLSNIRITDTELLPFVNNSCNPKEFYVTLIEHDHLRRCEETLLNIAPNSVLIVDEVHLALNETQRTSVALQLSNLALDFVALTGTPVIDTKLYKLIHWLEQIVEFEVNTNNFWVAANSMIAKKVNTGVIVIRDEIEANFTQEELGKYKGYVKPDHGGTNSAPSVGDYQLASAISYKACTRELINQTIYELQAGNRVFLVAKDLSHQEELNATLVSMGILNSDIFLIKRGKSIFLTDESVAAGQSPDYKIVIAPMRMSTGYTVTRMNVLIRSVYPVNNAVREQIEGRVNRLSQNNKEIKIRIVHAGILTYTLRHHNDAKNLADVLRTLAKDIN